jgi:predicted NBD/HSP70 family sugar kinase
VACVRYDNEHAVAAVVDLVGSVRWQRRWSGPFNDAEKLLKRVEEAAKLAVDAAGKAAVRTVAVGAADPGTVDVGRGAGPSARSTSPAGRTSRWVDRLRKATGAPRPHRARRRLAGARRGRLRGGARGRARGLRDPPRRDRRRDRRGGAGCSPGRDGSAGEIGHTRVSEDGPLCGCGGRGCLEAHLAPAHLVALWKGERAEPAAKKPARGAQAPDDFSLMLNAAREGDSRARKVLDEAAANLARGLGNVVSLLNPERIILGGRFVEAGDLLLEPLKQSLPKYALREMLQGIEVRSAELGEASAFLGVAAHVRDRMFAYPSVGAGFDESDGKISAPIRSEVAS